MSMTVSSIVSPDWSDDEHEFPYLDEGRPDEPTGADGAPYDPPDRQLP